MQWCVTVYFAWKCLVEISRNSIYDLLDFRISWDSMHPVPLEKRAFIDQCFGSAEQSHK